MTRRKVIISKHEAYTLAKKDGIKFHKDFFDLSLPQKNDLAAIALLAGYKRPSGGSGSSAKYFFIHLQTLANKENWD